MLSDREIAARLGPVLREIRLESGLSQNDMSELCGFAWTELSRYENGHILPSWNRYLTICKALRLPPGQLMMEIATGKRQAAPRLKGKIPNEISTESDEVDSET